MQPLDIFAVVVLLMLILAGIAVFIALGRLPRQIAEQRGNAYPDAVRVAGRIGVITLGLIWPPALWTLSYESQTVSIKPGGLQT